MYAGYPSHVPTYAQVTYAVEDREPPFLREEVDRFVARCFPESK